MGKLIFIHGVMEAGKSATLIQKAYLFTQKGKDVVVLKAASDIRSPNGKVKSRIGLTWDCLLLPHGASVGDVLVEYRHTIRMPDVILVDEAQFIDSDQVDGLAWIADHHKTLIIAYGLKNDFFGKLFPATKRFIELADRVDEVPSMCQCGRKATHHYRTVPGDNQVSCGGAEKYLSVCRRCFNKYNNKGTAQ